MLARKPVIHWGNLFWVLSMAARGGLMIAAPVLIGIGVGYWLDSTIGTIAAIRVPIFSLVLAAIGSILGPITLYRWTVQAVQHRMEMEKENEEKSE